MNKCVIMSADGILNETIPQIFICICSLKMNIALEVVPVGQRFVEVIACE